MLRMLRFAFHVIHALGIGRGPIPPPDFERKPLMQLGPRRWAVSLWGGRNLLAEQLTRSATAASQREEEDVALALAFAELAAEADAMQAPHDGYMPVTSPADAAFMDRQRMDGSRVRTGSGLHGFPVDPPTAYAEVWEHPAAAAHNAELDWRTAAILDAFLFKLYELDRERDCAPPYMLVVGRIGNTVNYEVWARG